MDEIIFLKFEMNWMDTVEKLEISDFNAVKRVSNISMIKYSMVDYVDNYGDLGSGPVVNVQLMDLLLVHNNILDSILDKTTSGSLNT